MFFTASISFGQSKHEDQLVDPNGKVISTTKVKNLKIRSSEETIELFYKNLNNIEELDHLINFRFYQKTPYYKFKEIMKEKNNATGEFIEKTLLKTKTSDDKNSIAYLYNVTYKNIKTTETITLIRESKDNSFDVYYYDIKKREN
jgi:hypothetical protein